MWVAAKRAWLEIDKYLKAVETYLNNMLLGNQTSRLKEKRRQLLALDSRAARLVGWGSKMLNPHKNCNHRICGLMQRHCRNLHCTSIHCLCKHRSHRKACPALTLLQCNPLFLEMCRATRCMGALTLLTRQICTQLDCLWLKTRALLLKFCTHQLQSCSEVTQKMNRFRWM